LTRFFKFEIKDPLEKAEEDEVPKPESEKRTTTVSKLSEGPRPIETGIGCLRTSIRRSSKQKI
jgi:hypothetical protein